MLKKKLQDSRFLMGTHLFIVLLGLAWIALSIKLNDKFEQFNWYYLIGIGVLLIANTFLWFRTPPTDRKPKLNKLFLILGFAEIILTTGLLIGFFILYFKFSTINLSELAWLMHADITGTNISTFYGDIIRGVIALILIIVAYFGLFRLAKKRNKQSRFVLWCFTVFFAGFCIVSGMHYKHLMVGEYLRNIGKYSPFIEDNYVDAGKVDITFKEKRNLIYIYLESMEPTFAGIENGGATQEDIIPELTAIAQENMDFGEGSALNGAYALNGATYTMGAMAAMTSGVGVSEDFFDNHIRNNVWEKDEYVTDYLPGVWSLGQVLEENGYSVYFNPKEERGAVFPQRLKAAIRDCKDFVLVRRNSSTSRQAFPEETYSLPITETTRSSIMTLLSKGATSLRTTTDGGALRTPSSMSMQEMR